MVNKVEFAELLVEYRGRCEWSQNELAEIMGVHRNTIASWESGTIPSRGVVLRLTDELSLSHEERNRFLKAAGFSDKQWPAKYWNVPYKQNPYFIGREEILQALRRRLIPGAKATALTQSISGLGGIGKTQVAIEYAHRYGEYYEVVLWIAADSQEVAMAGLLRLATEVLGLPEQQEAEQQIAAIIRWLQKRHNWLLIFDNAEDPQTLLSTFVPSKHQGSVMITTRRRDGGTLAHSEMLPLFSEEDAVLFLLRRAKRIAREASVTSADDGDYCLAKELCQLLGRLPLALDQAGAYIAENNSSLKRYIDLYYNCRQDLLDRRQAKELKSVTEHPDSVLMTFWLSWEQIQEHNSLAGKMLQFCAFLAPDQIPEPFVQAGVKMSEVENAQEELEMEEALGLLHRYSLIERAKQTLSLHRLVQEVMQEVLSEDEQHQWMERAVLIITTAFPSGEHETWPLCEFLLPHALVCSRWIPFLKQKKLEGARLLSVTGLYLHGRALYGEAEASLQRALSVYEEHLGGSHYDTAMSLNNLARLYRAQGRYKEAEGLYQRVLAICEQHLGAAHPHTAIILNNLADVCLAQGNYEQAEGLYQRALAIFEQHLGASHPQIGVSLNGLAELHKVQGNYEQAEGLYQRGLSIYEQHLGASHPQTGACLNNLAGLHQAQGRYREAEELYQRALAICEQHLGASHPSTGASLNGLAALYQVQGRYREAEALYQRALAICERHLGAAHPDTAAGLNNLAHLYRLQDRYGEAEALYQQALAICEQHLGASHPDTALCLNNLAEVCQVQGRHEQAEALYQRALSIHEQQLGNSHPHTAASLNNLAGCYQAQGRYGEAEPLYQRAAKVSITSLSMEHPQTQQIIMNLLTLLSLIHTNGDLQRLLQLLTLGKLDVGFKVTVNER